MSLVKMIAFDLETIADKSIIPLLPPIEADSRLKDPAKIKENIKTKETERINKLGLNPTTARICCFGWYDGKDSYHVMLKEETAQAEKALLSEVWGFLATVEHFITFNGNEFDVPMLMMRSLINRVRPSVNISIKKYVIANHTDVRAVLSNWNSHAKGSLDFYSRLLLGKSPKENMSGDMVQDAWDMEQFEDIGNYCEDDCKSVFEIYQLLTQYYL